MILLPAIDIRHGRAVRLRQGDFADETVYADDPLEAAQSWVEAGAQMLHVVDLDGALSGRPESLAQLKRITAAVGVPVQYGGGLRSADAIAAALDAGAERVVVGTAALRDRELLERSLAAHGDAVVVGVDARGGRVSVAGWTECVDESADELIARLERVGARRFVYTDVDRDGMLEGPNLDGILRVAEATSAELICSGGIGSLDDLRAIAGLGLANLTGVICGKALYEGRFGIAEGRRALER